MPGVEVEVASPVGSLHGQVESYEGGQLPEVSPRLAWENKLLGTSALTYSEELGELETLIPCYQMRCKMRNTQLEETGIHACILERPVHRCVDLLQLHRDLQHCRHHQTD